MPIKTYAGRNFGFNTSDLLSGTSLADDCKNVIGRADSGIESRKGTQHKIAQSGGYGLYRYNYVDSDNDLVDELILIDDKVYRLKEGNISIAYSGAQTHVDVSVTQESGLIRMKILENGTAVLNKSLGKGFEESSTDTMASLKTAIDALTGLAVTITGETTIPSAFLDITPNLYIQSGESQTITFIYAEELNKVADTPIDNLQNLKNTANLQNVDACIHNGLMILTDGGRPKVYDGQTIYKAGLPKPKTPVVTISDGGLIVKGETSFYIQYEYADARGKKTESDLSTVVTKDTDNSAASVTAQCLKKADGHDVHAAKVNGDQTATPSSDLVTLTVTSGKNTMKAGDTALIKNRNLQDQPLKTYEVLSVTATTVVVKSTENIKVSDEDIISNNLRVLLLREDPAELTKKIVAELPNDPFSGSVVLEDGENRIVINGAQTVVPNNQGKIHLTIDDGSGGTPNISVGDTVRFYNSHEDTDADVTHTISDLTDTTMSFVSTNTVTVTDNLDVRVSRTLSTFTEPIKTQGPPPEADFCVSFKGNLVLAKGQRVFYSDEINNGLTTSGLSFPPTHFINFPKKITGLAVSGDFVLVFGEDTVHGISSRALDTGIFNVVLVSNSIGCISSASIANIGDTVLFAADSGIYAITGRSFSSVAAGLIEIPLPQALSKNISNFFNDIGTLDLKRSVGVNDTRKERYILYVPDENPSNIDYAKNTSIALVLDYRNRQWYKWSDVHMGGGAAVFDKKLYFSERHSGPSLRRNLVTFVETGTTNDYWDHGTAIDAEYEFKWDTLSEISLGLPKKIKSARVYLIPRKPSDHDYNPTFTFKAYKDFVDNLLHTETTVSFDTPGKKWNQFLWNDRPVGSWQKVHSKIRMSADSAEAIKIKLSNSTGGTNMIVSALEVEWEEITDETLKT